MRKKVHLSLSPAINVDGLCLASLSSEEFRLHVLIATAQDPAIAYSIPRSSEFEVHNQSFIAESG